MFARHCGGDLHMFVACDLLIVKLVCWEIVFLGGLF
jgi:hypothetical protein